MFDALLTICDFDFDFLFVCFTTSHFPFFSSFLLFLSFHSPEATYILPDGKEIKRKQINTDIIYDSLFNAETGLTSLISNAIEQSDIDIRTSLWKNIVCVGGTTLLPEFERKLTEKLNERHSMVFIYIYIAKIYLSFSYQI